MNEIFSVFNMYGGMGQQIQDAAMFRIQVRKSGLLRVGYCMGVPQHLLQIWQDIDGVNGQDSEKG